MAASAALTAEKWNAKVYNRVAINITPRGGHGMVNYQNKMYLFGGAKKDGHLNDIFEVELESLSDTSSFVAKALPISTFPNLYEFTTALVGHKLWIFGGADKNESKNEVCTFNMETQENECERIQADNMSEAPSPRTQYGNKSLVEIDGSKHLVIFGGGCKQDKPVEDRNLHLFNTAKASWSMVKASGEPPSARQGHISVSFGNKVFIHGGLGFNGFDGFYDDLFCIDLSKPEKTWVEVDCVLKPCARAAHNVTVLSDSFYIFGGFDSTGQALSDFWKFDTKSSTWTQIKYTGLVPPRMDFGMCTIVTGTKTFIMLHGGFNSDCVFYEDFVQLSLSNETAE